MSPSDVSWGSGHQKTGRGWTSRVVHAYDGWVLPVGRELGRAVGLSPACGFAQLSGEPQGQRPESKRFRRFRRKPQESHEVTFTTFDRPARTQGQWTAQGCDCHRRGALRGHQHLPWQSPWR